MIGLNKLIGKVSKIEQNPTIFCLIEQDRARSYLIAKVSHWMVVNLWFKDRIYGKTDKNYKSNRNDRWIDVL